MRAEVKRPLVGYRYYCGSLPPSGCWWANVSWPERIDGLGNFHRLLMIPLLLAQFSTVRERRMGSLWIFWFRGSIALAANFARKKPLTRQRRTNAQMGNIVLCAIGSCASTPKPYPIPASHNVHDPSSTGNSILILRVSSLCFSRNRKYSARRSGFRGMCGQENSTTEAIFLSRKAREKRQPPRQSGGELDGHSWCLDATGSYSVTR
jgi:hypothetical protein